MNSALDVPGIEVGVIRGIDSDGAVRIERADGSQCAATPLWNGVEVDWSACIGLRAAVARTVARPDELLVVGVLDRPLGYAAARVERVQHLRASDELILECGKSKISLRADGRVVVLGGYLLSRSSGVNKIKGGSVEIN